MGNKSNKNLIYLVTLKPSSHRTAEENLGIAYLASVLLEKGYRVKIRDGWLDGSIDEEIIENEILKDKDEVLFVGTSSYMLNNKGTCQLIGRLVEKGIKVACGGFGPTFEPEMFLNSGAEMVMVGEGETTILEVADYFSGKSQFKKSEINGIVFLDGKKLVYTEKRRAVENLDDIPFPQRPYLDIVKNRHSTVNVLTSRGCMGSCTFCSISAFLCKQKSLRWRGRTIENVVLELKQLQDKGATTVKFVDDSFIENERDDLWCERFYNAVKANGITLNFRASIRADKVTERGMEFLRKAGFFSFSCGIENGSETALKRMAKLASIKDNERALKIFKKNNIYVQAGFILFDDKTTIKELEENYKFLKKYVWMVSKGIFSEMYAAVGTVFTKNANLESKNKFSSNNLYLVKNEDSLKVYNYLKKWQLHHSKVYDMVIDPISAPKAIAVSKMKKYYKLMIKMKKIDLAFMKDVLRVVKEGGALESLYQAYERKYKTSFEKINKKAEEFYLQDGLLYDANINGFLSANIQKGAAQEISFNDLLKENQILSDAVKLVSERATEEGSFEFFKRHFLPCAKWCLKFANKENALDVALMGIFHDYGKFIKGGGNDEHEISGSAYAKEYLEKRGYPKQNILNICNAILNHKQNANDEEMSDYSKILINADILSYFEEIDYFIEYLKVDNDDYKQKVVQKILLSLERLDAVGKRAFEESEFKNQIFDLINEE